MSAARLQSLDVVRGVAVMGILLLNIVSFGMPESAYLNPRAYGGWQGADLWVYLVNFVLFDGKMRGLFSFLFGASMLLVIERAEAGEQNPARVHYLRMTWLLLFGLAHFFFVWHGDILTLYAVVGMIAFLMRRMPVSRLIILGIMLVCLTTVLFSGIPFMVHQLSLPSANAAEAAGKAKQLQGFANGFGIPPWSEIAKQLALHRGDYAPILANRVATGSAMIRTSIMLFGPETLAYMLFGMAGLKSGMLRGEWDPRRYVKWLIVCWGIALPVYIAIAAYLVHEQFDLFAVALGAMVLSAPVRPLMFIGWACLILLLARAGGALTERIAATGRMAFTNYLMTSLICTTLFYGYGLGWYGYLTRWQLYLVVVAIWALMLLWSEPWLAHFRFGPLEWLWRSLARGRLQPIRGAAGE
jgi:uncharacterized protein